MTDKGHALFLQVRAFGDKGPSIFIDKVIFTDKGLTYVCSPSQLPACLQYLLTSSRSQT